MGRCFCALPTATATGRRTASDTSACARRGLTLDRRRGSEDATSGGASMSQPADRNLLLGILALQLDFLGKDALVKAMHAWVLEKAKPLGQLLQEQGALTAEEAALLEDIPPGRIRRVISFAE